MIAILLAAAVGSAHADDRQLWLGMPLAQVKAAFAHRLRHGPSGELVLPDYRQNPFRGDAVLTLDESGHRLVGYEIVGEGPAACGAMERHALARFGRPNGSEPMSRHYELGRDLISG